MVQQFVTSENKEHVEQRILPYLDQVLMVIIFKLELSSSFLKLFSCVFDFSIEDESGGFLYQSVISDIWTSI